MSHAPERKDKDCLNCGAIVQGRFCQQCGQENVVPHETFGHMVKHFFYDITHFDTKFFDSVRYLVTKPGFLPKEYMRGRRAHYLNPVKMYVFTSAMFFLIFFSLFTVKAEHPETSGTRPPETVIARTESYANTKAENKSDSGIVKKAFELIRKDSIRDKKDPTKRKLESKSKMNYGISFSDSDMPDGYRSVAEYDSIQNSRPASERDGWFGRLMNRKAAELNERSEEGEDQQLQAKILNKFFHSFPYILFISLPLYALFLKLLYIRRRKKFFFVDHGIFLIHLYVFTFILMLLVIGVNEFGNYIGRKWPGWIIAAIIIYGIWYTFKAMKNFYEQGTWKTLLKFILFNILCVFSISLLFMVFLLLTFFRA